MRCNHYLPKGSKPGDLGVRREEPEERIRARERRRAEWERGRRVEEDEDEDGYWYGDEWRDEVKRGGR